MLLTFRLKFSKMSDAANASASGDATGANGSPEYIKLKVVGQVI